MFVDMFKGMLLTNKSVKRSQKQNKKTQEKKGAKGREEIITELISADTSQPIITDVNVEGVVSRTRDQLRYLKEMAKNGKISEKALSTIEEYIPGLLEENGQLSVTEDHQRESTGSESESDQEQ